MQSHKITVGGTVHVMGGRVPAYNKRIEIWNELDPERACEEVGLEARTRRELLDSMVENSGVGGHLVSMLNDLHTAMCDFYIRHIAAVVLRRDGDTESGDVSYVTGGLVPARLTVDIDIAKPGVGPDVAAQQAWVRKRYTRRAHDLKFWIRGDSRPGTHYSDSAWLIKNMRFTGWQPDTTDQFGGFCIKTPVARLRQLVAFPIEKFGVDINQLPCMQWPEAPHLDRPDDEFVDRVATSRELTPDHERYEQYYIQLTEKIGELVQALVEQ